MGEYEPSPYETRDFETVLNFAHHALCLLDRRDREAGRDPQWQLLEDIAREMQAFLITEDIWYLAEFMLHDERGLVERDSRTLQVRLTRRGRELCGQRLREE
ncbi:MAG: hypothetical protein ACRD8W_09835 [Nitrososphaeraceae archaeon]